MEHDTLIDRVVDICSSGMGGDLGKWHKRTLKEEFDLQLKTDQEREDFLTEELIPYMFDSDGWSIDDIRSIKEILKIEKPIQLTI